MDDSTQQYLALALVAVAVLVELVRRWRKRRQGKPGCDGCDTPARQQKKNEAPLRFYKRR